MNQKHPIIGRVLLTGLSLFFLLCSGARRERALKGGSETDVKPPVVGETIAPNKCRIVATVLAIDSTLQSGETASPCARVPCQAIVRVDSILGYGQAFVRPLSKGERIQVMFVFTVGPTKGLFPNMTENYPGVRVGSRFLADVGAHDEPMSKDSGTVSFLVYGYEVR